MDKLCFGGQLVQLSISSPHNVAVISDIVRFQWAFGVGLEEVKRNPQNSMTVVLIAA